jgi:hypothetical protein
MSELPKADADLPVPVSPDATSAEDELSGVDCTGLARAIDILQGGSLQGEPLVLLMRHELTAVQRQAQLVTQRYQQASIELRQLRESAQREHIQRLDDQRQSQEQNDRFVSNLIYDHEQELQAVRRERDAAIDRVRELSRGLNRAASGSSGNWQRASSSGSLQAVTVNAEAAELKSRVDELLFERERSLKLLRQLAEQRDQAETRLQVLLSDIKARATAATPATSKTSSGEGLPALAHRQHPARPTTGHAIDTSPSAPNPETANGTGPMRADFAQSGYSLSAEQLVKDNAFAPNRAKSPRK